MRLLVVGLNPSVYSADVGVGYGRPGNRFWPAALRRRARDARPRPVPCAARPRCGHDRPRQAGDVERGHPHCDPRSTGTAWPASSGWCSGSSPGAVCFVGLTGWRHAVDRARGGRAARRRRIGGRPVYVMPSTSGANAHAQLDALSAHLGAATSLASGGVTTLRPDGVRWPFVLLTTASVASHSRHRHPSHVVDSP